MTQITHLPMTVHSGKFAERFLFPGTMYSQKSGIGILSQTLTTTPGQMYTLSFWALDDNAISRETDPFSIFWGGSRVTGAPINLPNDDTYHEYTFSVTAASSTPLKFQTPFMNSEISWTIALDDVSVIVKPSPVPALMGVVPGLGFACRRLRRRS